MTRSAGRFWAIPAVTLALAGALGVTTHLEQERQFEGVRALYESHAAFAGKLVREGMQEAAWATDLVYSLSAGGIADLLGLLGPARPEECEDVVDRVEDLSVWATRDAGGLRGCFGPVPEPRREAFVDAVAAAPDPDFAEPAAARALGLYCARRADGGAVTVVCRDRARLDEMRREVGLGPLLSSLRDRELDYVVIQDAGGILAASPNPGPVSSWADDPFLHAVLDAGEGTETSRLTERGGAPVLEVVGTLLLGDGTRAVLRMGLDASGLSDLKRRIDRRQVVSSAVLGAAVLLSAALAFALARAARKRREHDEALRHRDEEARHWQSLGHMAATVAHEVRNPLNAIGMAIQRLRAEFEVPPGDRAEYDELLRMSADASDRVERVVSEFLDLGRPLALDRAPHDAATLVREVLAPMALRAERESKVLAVDCTCAGEVRLDRRRLAQVVTNLVANALDAVPAGGRVTVTAGCDGAVFRLRVVDDGPGMDDATLSRAIEPFVTTKAHGTGLGLPLAKRLVEAHGGTLALASAPGRGTEVTVTIPRGGTT
ncbi:MAG: HAMP domain-containing histidine kinase [Deltaproteobacteria bacterium]|nr:HAMP domain-containing histidine kinase [Deltaproteobacteria bacterium]